MIGLKADAYQFNLNGSGQYEFLTDVSTRALLSVRIGEGAGKISRGNGNVFAGYEAGKQNTGGSYGVFLGFQAGALNQYGNENVFVGSYSGKYNQRGNRNTFVGYQSGELNKDGSDCTAVGLAAMRENTVGNKNVAVGTRAGERILDGDNNTMVGMESGQDIRSGNNNTMTGYRSGRASFKGNENTYFGAFAGYSNSFGDGNAFMGFRAGEFLGYGNYNVALGAYALQKALYGSCNIAVGAFAGSYTTGSGNVFVGTGAGSSNFFGDNSTYVGQNAGAQAQGSDNVYIGTRAAYYLSGNKNVVIGVEAVPDQTLSGSVMIGYRTGYTTFKYGTSNIFIGSGADSHTPTISFGIAIGSRNTKTFDSSISIGEDINNSGINSVLVGNEIYSDANQCVSIGKGIDVSSVYVFNDLLNYRFPVNLTEGYSIFGLQEGYCNTLYLNGVSNEIAIATANTSNLYDSGSNLLPGTTQSEDYNNRILFSYNILYQGNSIQFTSDYTTLDIDITSNLLTSNQIITDNFSKYSIQILPDGDSSITSNDVIEATRKVILDASNILSVLPSGTISSNLVPYEDPANRFYYTYAFPKKSTLYAVLSNSEELAPSSSYDLITNPTTYIPILPLLTISSNLPNLGNSNALPEVTSNLAIEYERRYYLLSPPTNGYTCSNCWNYYLYPEALYASNDSFQVTVSNRIAVQSQTDKNVYGIIPEPSFTTTHTIHFQSNISPVILMTSNIPLHPAVPTPFTQTYFTVLPPPLPTSSLYSCNLTLLSMDSNLTLTYLGTIYTYSNLDSFVLPYQDWTTSSLLLSPTIQVTDSNLPIVEPITFLFQEKEYRYSCFYNSNVTSTASLSSSNITITLPCFALHASFTSNLPFDRSNYPHAYIHTYPTYGTIVIPEDPLLPMTYTPQTLHFPGDHFTILLQSQDPPTLLQLNTQVNYDNSYHSIELYKLQEPVNLSPPTYQYTVDAQWSQSNIPFYTYHTCNISISSSPDGQDRNDSYQETLPNNYPYSVASGGYPYQSNISIVFTYTVSDWSTLNTSADKFGLVTLPNINETGFPYSNTGIDYILYDGIPKTIYRTAPWDYAQDGPGTFTESQVNITTDTSTTRSNLFSYNRYYTLVNTYTYETVFKHGSNFDIYHSNAFDFHDKYYDLYHQYIYTSNYSLPLPQVTDSNITYLIDDSSNLPSYRITNHYIRTSRTITSNIPTLQLQNTHLYQQNGTYQLSPSAPYQPLIVLQTDVGPVTSFHQSNIANHQIHVWNPLPSIDQVISTSNLLFTDNRTLTINYLQNRADSYTLDSSTLYQDVTYWNLTPTTPHHLRFDTSYLDGTVIIQHTCNVSFTKKGTGISGPSLQFTIGEIDAGELFTVPSLLSSNNGFVEYVIYNNSKTTPPIKKSIPSTYLINQTNYQNLGIDSEDRTYITSNHLYYQTGTFSTSNILYEITGYNPPGLRIYKNNVPLSLGDSFYQEDLTHNTIRIQNLTTLGSNYFTYDVKTNTGTPLLPSQTFSVEAYLQNKFLPSSFGQTTSNIIIQAGGLTEYLYQHQLRGSLWEYLRQNTQFRPEIRDTTLHILQPPTHGYFLTSNTASAIPHPCSSYTYETLRDPNTRVYYIPYSPMSLSNDSFQIFFSYSNVSSPIYTISLKNYWSRWSELVIPVHNEKFYESDLNNTFYYPTSQLPRSAGMVQDGITWSPETITFQGRSSNLQDKTSNISLTLSHENIPFQVQVKTVPITQRKTVLTSNIQKQVDNGNYFYLKYLADTVSAPTQPGLFYITQKPTHGVILKKKQNSYEAEPYFTLEDVQMDRVFYQHYGLLINSNIIQTDSFTVYPATCPWDMKDTPITTSIQVLEAPRLTVNNYDYIYYSCNLTAQSTYTPLPPSRLNLTKGYITIYSQSNVEFFTSNISTQSYEPTSNILQQDIQNQLVFYRPSSNLFRYGSNQNEIMGIQFTTNSLSDILLPNPLASTYPIYQTRVIQEWYSKYNTYDSKNIVTEILNSNQTISYTRVLTPSSSNFSYDNRKCEIQFEFLPYQPPLAIMTNPQDIQTFHYTFEITDTSNQKLINVDVTQSNVRVQTATQTVLTIQDGTIFPMDNNWKSFNIINYDDLNDKCLSIYFNGINYTQGLNIPSLSFTNLGEFKINVPIYDTLNYYNYTVSKQISPSTDTYIYYNLENFHNQLKFRNFNIFLATYEQDQTLATSGIYNVVIGNDLDIKGLNNICLGRNFVTTGQGSIIVGSDIGINATSSSTINEIFNSIVISNGSFINSKVRDTIAIGNQILNDLTINIEDFLAKRPVLIGNGINQSKIDFHINFQNTFVKTTVGSPQIYCGLEEEHVGIGYTTNAQFSSPYRLHVSGGQEVIGATKQVSTTGSIATVKQLFGPLLYTTGTSNQATFLVSWDTTQTSDYQAFSIHGKFRATQSPTSHAYRRFEAWVTPKDDIISFKPGLLTDMEVANYETGIITGLGHSINRYNEKTIAVTISWVTSIPLSPTDYLSGMMELEISHPTVMGELVIR